MSKIKLPLKQAESLARRIVAELAPGCSRIEIAGSIRRKKAEVGDIEIVCIPVLSYDLWGGVTPNNYALESVLFNLVQAGRLVPGGKDGSNYKKFFIPAVEGLQLDLFITSPECWPVIFAIRTGPADFSRMLVTQRSRGGYLPSNMRVEGGRVWEGDKPMKFETEIDFLEICGGWIEPEIRRGKND